MADETCRTCGGTSDDGAIALGFHSPEVCLRVLRTALADARREARLEDADKLIEWARDDVPSTRAIAKVWADNLRALARMS